MKIMTDSAQKTMEIGKDIADHLKPGDVIYLCGDLGSGKTVLVKGICRGLEVEEDVTSSSFVIVTEYKGKMPVSHIDLYRLDKEDIDKLPIHEYILEQGITLIEWADRMNDNIEGVRIRINILGKNKRELVIEDSRD